MLHAGQEHLARRSPDGLGLYSQILPTFRDRVQQRSNSFLRRAAQAGQPHPFEDAHQQGGRGQSEDRNHHGASLGDMLDERFPGGLDLVRAAERGIERKTARAGGNRRGRRLGGRRIVETEHGRLQRAQTLLGGADALAIQRAEERDRAHQNERTAFHQTGSVHGAALEARAAEGVVQPFERSSHERRLRLVHRHFAQIAVLQRQFGRLQRFPISLEFRDVQAGLEIADVLPEQVGQVRLLFLPGLDLGPQVAQVEGPAVQQSRGLLILAADLRQLVLKIRQLLTERNLLFGNLLPQPGQFREALLKLLLRGCTRLAERAGGGGLRLPPILSPRDSERHDKKHKTEDSSGLPERPGERMGLSLPGHG